MLKALPAEPVELNQYSKQEPEVTEEGERKNMKDTMRRLDRQLVAVSDVLRTLSRRT